jgi:hypothetical protein
MPVVQVHHCHSATAHGIELQGQQSVRRSVLWSKGRHRTAVCDLLRALLVANSDSCTAVVAVGIVLTWLRMLAENDVLSG